MILGVVFVRVTRGFQEQSALASTPRNRGMVSMSRWRQCGYGGYCE